MPTTPLAAGPESATPLTSLARLKILLMTPLASKVMSEVSEVRGVSEVLPTNLVSLGP